MEDLFNNIGKHLYTTGKHKGYLVKWKVASPICNKKWSRNRDPDNNRVNEMIEYYKNGGYIPKIIHFAELQEEGGLVCYDGNHRRNVFNTINDDNIECIIDIMINATQEEIYDCFNNINKSVQLPAIYLDDNKVSTNIKIDIINLVKKFEDKYKMFVSASPRCRVPNFNRDNLVDNIYDIYKSLNGTVDINYLENVFGKLNAYYRKGIFCRPHSNYTKNVIDKCEKYDLWLFLEKNISIEHVQKVIDDKDNKLLQSIK